VRANEIDNYQANDAATEDTTINTVNEPPLAEDDAVITDEDNPVTVAATGVLNNDSDPDVGDTLNVTAVDTGGTLGAVTAWSPDGSFTYDADGQFEYLQAGSSTTDSFTYTVSDGALDASASVAISVLVPNTAPLAVTDTAATLQGAAIDISEIELLANDSDADGDALALAGVARGFGGTVSWDEAGRIVRFEPETYFFGEAWFSYALSDGRDTVAGRVEVAVSIDVSGNALLGTAGADALQGGRGDERLYGLGGNDLLDAGRGNDTLWGGPGADLLDGGWGDDVYVFQHGDGAELIDNRSSKASDYDLLQFTAGFAPEDLWFVRDANDLLIGVIGSDDRVVIDEWYGADDAKLDEIRVPGARLLASQVDQLVQAMAAFDAPIGTGLSLPEDTRQQLEPVIAAAWQSTG